MYVCVKGDTFKLIANRCSIISTMKPETEVSGPNFVI